MRTVKLGEMTVLDVRNYLKSNRTVILPYGVVEQHGYHLPLDTDIRNATFMGEKLAEKLGCVVAPTLNYCFSGGMLEGTVNVRPTTFCNMVCETVESLALQGFENIIIIPGHGGSESLVILKESLRIMKWLNASVESVMVALIQLWNFSPTWLKMFKERDYHAGAAETSLILHWSPEVVGKKYVLDAAKIAEGLRDDPDSYQIKTKLSSFKDEIPSTRQRKEIKVGVMGCPEKASAELGRKIEAEILKNAAPALKKAIAEAARNRKNKTRVPDGGQLEKLKILSL